MSRRLDLSLVLVAHRSAALLPAALAAFRREASAAGLAAEVVVVEHSEDDGETERVRAARPDVLLVRANRGYAAGVNAGLEVARGERLLVGNPDVELAPGALAPMLDALANEGDVVGPQLTLAGTLFPPADLQTPVAELARRRAGRTRAAWEHHLRCEIARWSAVWQATAPIRVPALSGALLAFSADVAERLGPMPEDYFLYFEETEWLQRARRAGIRLTLVPASRARHRWGHSARPEAFALRFAASQRRYYRRAFPWRGRLALAVPSAAPPPALPWPPATLDSEWTQWTWLLSPQPQGFPAAWIEPPASVEEVVAAFCRACERPAVTLVGVAPGGARLLGPFAWSLEAARAEGGAGVGAPAPAE